jgi:Nuclease-related domain
MESSRRPGQFAREVAEHGVRSHRQMVLRHSLLALLPFSLATLGLALWTGSWAAWFAAGFTFGGFAMAAFAGWSVVPRHVEAWALGAEGEEATAAVIEPLLADGWEAEHDVQLGRGNVDHVLTGPTGVFMLESKALWGELRVEAGVLHQSFAGQPTKRHHDLASAALWRAAEVSRRIGAVTGKAPWVQAVVVLWGDFPQRLVADDRLVYVHGTELVRWLRSLSEAQGELVANRATARRKPPHPGVAPARGR